MRVFDFVSSQMRGNFGGAFVRLLCDERGATAIEYGLLAALVAIAGVVAMSSVGTNLSSTFTSVADNL